MESIVYLYDVISEGKNDDLEVMARYLLHKIYQTDPKLVIKMIKAMNNKQEKLLKNSAQVWIWRILWLKNELNSGNVSSYNWCWSNKNWACQWVYFINFLKLRRTSERLGQTKRLFTFLRAEHSETYAKRDFHCAKRKALTEMSSTNTMRRKRDMNRLYHMSVKP